MSDPSNSTTPVEEAPPPPGPPLYTPEQLATHDNATTTIIAVLWFLVGISALFLILRVYCKFKTNRGLWWDDYILLASWVCLVGDSVAWTVACVFFGYGVHQWDYTGDIGGLFKTLLVSSTFVLVGIIWSKTAFGVTLLRLTEGWMRWAVWFCIITTNIFMGLSILFNFIHCNPIAATWDPDLLFQPSTKCWPGDTLLNYHIFAASYSAVMDIALAFLPWKLVWSLQMKRREKAGVAIAMSMGIFAGITSIIKVTTLPAMKSNDMYDGVQIVYWGAAEIATTIIAASIPVLRVLIRHVHSTARKYYRTGEGYGTKSKTHGSRNHTVVISTRNDGGEVGSSANTTMGTRTGGAGTPADDMSDKSILQTSSGKVMMTNEVSVNYQYRKDGDSLQGYEMDHV